jgi:hypothetical protein
MMVGMAPALVSILTCFSIIPGLPSFGWAARAAGGGIAARIGGGA